MHAFRSASGPTSKRAKLNKQTSKKHKQAWHYVLRLAEHSPGDKRGSFFVIYGAYDSNTVSEIDSEGRVVRVLDTLLKVGTWGGVCVFPVMCSNLFC